MMIFDGYWYDGQSSQRQVVKCQVTDDHIQLIGEGFNQHYRDDAFTLMPRVASAPAKIQFAGGGLCELPPQDGLDKLYQQFHHGSVFHAVHYIENHLYSIVLIAMVSLTFIASFVVYGVPTLAKYVAEHVPPSVEQETGEQTLQLIDRGFCEPSKLPEVRQADLRSQMFSWVSASQRNQIRVEFRHCERIGPNALALPSGIMVFTDQLVEIAEDDLEILGVFGHELGHVTERHSLRMVLQSSVIGLLAVVITGDVGTASSIAVTLPVILIETGFSREFEHEADTFGATMMLQQGKSPVHLANILKRMDEGYDEASGLDSFLSTHPLTQERVNYLTNFTLESAKAK